MAELLENVPEAQFFMGKRLPCTRQMQGIQVSKLVAALIFGRYQIDNNLNTAS